MKKSMSVKIEGVKTILFHAFKEEVLDKNKAKSGTAGNNPNEWKTTVIMDERRRLYLPSSYLFAPIREAGKYTKIGRGTISKHIASTLEISPDIIFLEGLSVPEEWDKEAPPRDPSLPVYLDARSVVNPMTKGRNMRYRVACHPGWKCSFQVGWDDTVLSFDTMEKILKDAGVMCGTGCGRAIGFGRWKVLEIKKL